MTTGWSKHPDESAITDHTYKVFPNDLNSYGTVFGGLILATCDRIALVVAERHSGQTCVTVSIDSVHFLKPSGHGDILLFSAKVNRSWRTSMEIGVIVYSEHHKTHQKERILSAYFTFVAVDDDKHPIEVPQLIPETKSEKRRYQEAEDRRSNRKSESEKHKAKYATK